MPAWLPIVRDHLDSKVPAGLGAAELPPASHRAPKATGGGLVLGWAEVHDSGPLHHGRTRRVPLGPRQSCAVLVAVALHPQPESSAPAPAALCLMLSLPNSFLHDKETC